MSGTAQDKRPFKWNKRRGNDSEDHMDMYSSLSDILTQSGALADCDSVIAYPDLKSWTVALDDKCDLELCLDEQIGLIHISSDVAPCPEESEGRVLKTLLEYNEQWLATGGVRFGLDGARQTLTLTASFPTADLEPEAMARRLVNMARLLDDWQTLFSGESSETEAADTEPTVDTLVLKV